MRQLPVPDPGLPDHRSPRRYLVWVARTQRRSLLGGIALGIIWMISQALMPAVIGRAIDEGITPKDVGALCVWAGVLLGLGVVQAVSGVTRHRFAVYNWLAAAYRTVQVISRQATRLGGTLPKRLTTGEVVSVGIADVAYIGDALDITARGAGAVVAIAAVAGIMLATSPPLGLIVVIGVPVIIVAVAPLLRPLHRRQVRQRELTGELNTRAADIVAGLRVLRGVGGEQVFAGRYRKESQGVRRAGVEVARAESMLNGAEVLLPGLLIVLVTWVGARFAVEGRISVGHLVAFYGYAVFLIEPMRTLGEAADKITKAHVAAARVVRVLALEPEFPDEGTRVPPSPAWLTDPASGLVVRPGRLTAIAAADPVDAQTIADRLGRYAEAGEARYGGVPLAEVAGIRRRILVSVNDDLLFSGRLRDELTGDRRPTDDHDPSAAAGAAAEPQVTDVTPETGESGETGWAEETGWAGDDGDLDLDAALYAACAQDIVDEVGLDSHVEEAGREFSGGQRQRLRLARALAADPEVLVLVEPTSAVDAHTEARIAGRLAKARGGRTTVVCTTSPLVLDRADHVVYVEDGRVAAEGTHADLLRTAPAYAATVTREESAE